MNKKNLEIALQKYARVIKEALIKDLKEKDNIASGRLQSSIKTSAGKSSINIFAADYIGVIDQGRTAGKKRPPISSIAEWIKDKRIQIKDLSVKNKRDLAFVIARAIGEKGTIQDFGYKGTGILTRVIEELRPAMTSEFQEALRKDIDEELKQ